MVTDLFGTILQELGKLLEIPDLHPDRNHSCLIKLKNGQSIQLELDRGGHFLILGADLGEVPPGKYRENLFKEALKANEMPYPLHGILAYSKKSEHLILFEKLYARELNGEKVFAALTPFAEKALIWEEALKHNDIPVLSQVQSPGRSSGMFGLRP